MYYALGVIVFIFILDVQGSLTNTQCKRTHDWNGYQFQCSKNHTIYIKYHIIEDGFHKSSSPIFGCQETDALYCGVKLPINQTLRQNNSAFSSAVRDCNGKIQCHVSAQYFKDVEAGLRKSCSQSHQSDLNKAKFRQSIDYECIQDYQVIDMDTNRKYSRSPHVYLRLSPGYESTFSCKVNGDISRVDILQTTMAELIIYNESRPLYEHKHSSVSLYGVELQVNTKKLLIHIQGKSAASHALIKVLGNLTIRCEELKLTSTVQDQDPVSTPLTSVETHQKGEQIQKHSLSGQYVKDVTSVDVMVKSLNGLRRAFQEQKTSTGQVFSMMSAESKSTLNSNEITSKKYGGLLDVIQVSFGVILILLVIFLINKQRSHKSNTIQINDKGERFVLVFPPKQEDGKKSIEIHRADCLCNQSETSEIQPPLQHYTPLQAVNGTSTYTELSLTNEYLDVVRET
ncbi:uncharacterized protein LOC134255778 isoform X2 [Saccostrea cucullata]|uniref:uncharacterized protein LOC134255778 isoform X2 n=1 Tax=Saccostrea cuccullata TaxID=36930 RepID=UPI002ED017AE